MTTIEHHPVMLLEVLEALNVIPEGIYVDGTFGRGGHSHALLSRLGPAGKLICLDKDPQAIAYGRAAFEGEERVSLFHACFSELERVKGPINGILLDLGVSSPQLEEGIRGFSFMREGPLDMRLDPTQGLSAKIWLNEAPVEEIAWVLKRYGEESAAKKIANQIVKARQEKPLCTTLELAQLVVACTPAYQVKKGRHPATKTFQAIRIHINQELQAIEHCLNTVATQLTPGGRLAIISFHSLEDRIIKRFFQAHSRITLPKGVALPEDQLIPPFKWVIKRQRPSEEEIKRNPRARSAILRVGEKRV